MKSMRIFNTNLAFNSARPASALVRLAALLLAVASLGLTGCVSTSVTPGAKVSAITGRVFSEDEVREVDYRMVLGDQSYAEVNSAWLRAFNESFRAELFRQGISRWDSKFDCNHFSDLYRSLAQAAYFRSTFNRSVNAQALAVGTVWYVRSSGERHAIVQALTERGRIFIEPQTGEEVHLSPVEIESTYFAAM